MRLFRRKPAVEIDVRPPDAFLRQTFGDELSDKLIQYLGLERAAAFAETSVAEAQERWSHRGDDDFLTEEENEAMIQKGRESGTMTIESRAAVFTMFKAEKVAGEVASEAMKRAKLPDDRDLYLEIGARILLALE